MKIQIEDYNGNDQLLIDLQFHYYQDEQFEIDELNANVEPFGFNVVDVKDDVFRVQADGEYEDIDEKDEVIKSLAKTIIDIYF